MEIAVDLGSLFDRFSPFGLLFPNEDAFTSVMALLNDKELQHLWAEDETIGWIYQYWNSKEERKAMRDASAAPRNSRELAVRNQFFTPRYVVEFLTDNTLGRIWYEMTKGRDPPRRAVPLPRPPPHRDLSGPKAKTPPTRPKATPKNPSARKSSSNSPSTSPTAPSKTRARSASSIPPAAPCTSASTPSTSSRQSTKKPGDKGLFLSRPPGSLPRKSWTTSATSRASSSSTTSTASTSTPAPSRSLASPSGSAPRKPGKTSRRRAPPRPPLEHRLRRAHARQRRHARRLRPNPRPAPARRTRQNRLR